MGLLATGSTGTPGLLVGLIGLLVVPVIIGVLGSVEWARRRRIRAWATSHAGHYEGSSLRLVEDFPGEPFIMGARSAKSVAVVRAKLRGRRMVSFDYRVGSRRDGTETSRYTVIAVQLGHLAAGTDPVPPPPRARERLAPRGPHALPNPERTYAEVVFPFEMRSLLAATDMSWRTSRGWLVLWAEGLNRARELDGRCADLGVALDEVPYDARTRLGWHS